MSEFLTQTEVIRKRDAEVASAKLWRFTAVMTLGTAGVAEAVGSVLTARYGWRYADGAPLGCLVGGAIDAAVGAVALISAAYHNGQAEALTVSIQSDQ